MWLMVSCQFETSVMYLYKDQLVDLVLGAHVDTAGGFIQQQHLRLSQQPAADDDLLLVTAGEAADLSLLRGSLGVVKMAEIARDSLYLALDTVGNYSEQDELRVREMEAEVDKYEDALGTYLVKLNNRDLLDRDSHSISVILHCINDFERISDHAVNIVESAKEMHEKKLSFSETATKEFAVFQRALRDVIKASVDAYINDDTESAKMVEPLEQVINGLNAELKQRHIKRLRSGKCTIELGWVLQDLLTNIERVSDHCSNIAICMIEVKEDEFEAHGYLEELKEANVKWFMNAISELKTQYVLPDEEQ